jgi:hypothetical protein
MFEKGLEEVEVAVNAKDVDGGLKSDGCEAGPEIAVVGAAAGIVELACLLLKRAV